MTGLMGAFLARCAVRGGDVLDSEAVVAHAGSALRLHVELAGRPACGGRVRSGGVNDMKAGPKVGRLRSWGRSREQ